MTLGKINKTIDYSDGQAVFSYEDRFLQEVVQEVGVAIKNNRNVVLRIETQPNMDYDQQANTRISSCKHINDSLILETSESQITVINPEIEEGHFCENAFKFYIRNDNITITVVIDKR